MNLNFHLLCLKSKHVALYNCCGIATEAFDHAIVKHVVVLPSLFTPIYIFLLNKISAEALMDYLLNYLQLHHCAIIYTMITLALALICCDGTF